MNCKQLNDRASRYLEGDYGLVQKLSFWAHIAMCVHCRRYLKQLGLAVETARLMSRFKEPSEAEIDALVNRIKSIETLGNL